MEQNEREIKKLEKQLENVLKRRRKILDKALLSGISAKDYLEMLLYDRMPVYCGSPAVDAPYEELKERETDGK